MVFIILAMLFYTASILLGAISARNTDSNLSAGIINLVAAIAPMVAVIPILKRLSWQDDKFGILMAILAGVMVAGFTMALAKSFSINKVAIVTPIVFGGMIFLSSILSYLLFKEKVTMIQLIGLISMGIGLTLIIYAKATGN